MGQEPRDGFVGSSASVFHKPAVKSTAEAGVSFEGLTGAGSDSRVTQVVGRIQSFQSCLLRASLLYWQLAREPWTVTGHMVFPT